jgi:hypothetical protein
MWIPGWILLIFGVGMIIDVVVTIIFGEEK